MISHHSKKGFTLVELIIVIAIIAVLASLAFMALSGETAQARDSKRVSDLKTFEDSVSTSNGKNKKIGYALDSVGQDHAGAVRDDTAGDTLETNAGILKAIRGSFLIPVNTTLFDSDVLPTAARDPKGSYYLGAFLSNTDYLFFATKENPDTKIPTALVRGSFKDGSILDVLSANLGGISTAVDVTVANPSRFVRGDVIKVDDELMVVRERDLTNSQIKVDRGFVTTGGTSGINTATIIVHNKGASIKLMTPATGGDSLLCLGTLVAAQAGTITAPSTGTAAQVMSGTVNSLTLTASSAATAAVVGSVCNAATSSATLTDDGTVLPYRVN